MDTQRSSIPERACRAAETLELLQSKALQRELKFLHENGRLAWTMTLCNTSKRQLTRTQSVCPPHPKCLSPAATVAPRRNGPRDAVSSPHVLREIQAVPGWQVGFLSPAPTVVSTSTTLLCCGMPKMRVMVTKTSRREP
jgi:hypothetical protein